MPVCIVEKNAGYTKINNEAGEKEEGGLKPEEEKGVVRQSVWRARMRPDGKVRNKER